MVVDKKPGSQESTEKNKPHKCNNWSIWQQRYNSRSYVCRLSRSFRCLNCSSNYRTKRSYSSYLLELATDITNNSEQQILFKMEHINLHNSRKVGLNSILLWIRINCLVNNSGTRWYSKTLLSNHGCFIMFSWNIADRSEIVFWNIFKMIINTAPNSKLFAPTYFFAPMAQWHCEYTTSVVPSYQSTLKVKSETFPITPDNDGLENDFPLPGVHAQVPCSSSGV